MNSSSWALDLRLDGRGTPSTVEWWSFSRCIPGLPRITISIRGQELTIAHVNLSSFAVIIVCVFSVAVNFWSRKEIMTRGKPRDKTRERPPFNGRLSASTI